MLDSSNGMKTMTQELNTTIRPACGASAISDLLAASIVALQAAIQTDLPTMTTLVPVPGAAKGLPQGLQRDLHAAEQLYGVRFGSMQAVTHRPEMADTRTLICPQGNGYSIVVLCVSGSAAIYKPSARDAKLMAIVQAVTPEMLREWGDACMRQDAEVSW